MGGKEISVYVVKTIRRVDGSYQNNLKMTTPPSFDAVRKKHEAKKKKAISTD
jgi:hypothetical protein